jgi:transposase-like protein
MFERQGEIRRLQSEIAVAEKQVMTYSGKPGIGNLQIRPDGTVLSDVRDHLNFTHGGVWDDSMTRYDYTPATQQMTRVYIRGGRFYKHPTDNAQTVNTIGMISGAGEANLAIYVMSSKGVFHIDEAWSGLRHHSSLLAGANVPCAGEMRIRNGELELVSNESGHYKPNAINFLQVLHQLSKPENGVYQRPFNLRFDNGGGARYVSIEQLLMELGLRGRNLTLGKDEAYDYYNLLYGYGDIVGDAAWMQTQGLRWEPNANPRGVYRIAGNQWIASRDARTIINNAKTAGRADAREAAIAAGTPKPTGAGKNQLGNPANVNAWRNA